MKDTSGINRLPVAKVVAEPRICTGLLDYETSEILNLPPAIASTKPAENIAKNKSATFKVESS